MIQGKLIAHNFRVSGTATYATRINEWIYKKGDNSYEMEQENIDFDGFRYINNQTFKEPGLGWLIFQFVDDELIEDCIKEYGISKSITKQNKNTNLFFKRLRNNLYIIQICDPKEGYCWFLTDFIPEHAEVFKI